MAAPRCSAHPKGNRKELCPLGSSLRLGKTQPEGFRQGGASPPGHGGAAGTGTQAASGEIYSWKESNAPNADAIISNYSLQNLLNPGALSPVLLTASKFFLSQALFSKPH